MARDKLTEYDSTAANNTVVGDVNLAENSALPSDMNNAVRELMSHQKEAFGSGTPLYVDQTNNRVGIGTVTPDSNLKIKSTGAAILRIDGGAVASSVGPLIVGEHNDADAFYIGTNSVVLGETPNQDVVIYGADSSSGNIRFYAGASTETARIRNGGGLTFNGETAAANALDDYEEGTWTPTIVGSITASSVTTSFTKIGQMVFVTCQLVVATNTNSSNLMQISGLPYTASGDGAGTLAYTTASISNFVAIQLQTTSAYFYTSGGGILTPSTFSNKHLRFSGLYKAA